MERLAEAIDALKCAIRATHNTADELADTLDEASEKLRKFRSVVRDRVQQLIDAAHEVDTLNAILDELP
jgi:uncharacterized coiled-coil DUF342 family protein